MAATNGSDEIRLTRVYDAPVRAVWDAWAIPEQIALWWGPRGFTLSTHSKALRPGGQWRYTMHGPDGTDYPNVATYHVVEPCQRLVYDHGATDNTPPLFQVTATFTEGDGQTTLHLVFKLPSPEAAAQIAAHIRQAGGNATWDRLTEHLAETLSGRRCFVIHRSLPAPIEQVFAMWTEPALLEQWLPPPQTTMRFVRASIAAGGGALFTLSGPHGTMHVSVRYTAFEPPHRLTYTQQFVDAHGQVANLPGLTHWPSTLQNTVRLTPEPDGQTRVTVTTEPVDGPTPAAVEAFVRERAGMTGGWSHSFDVLESRLGHPREDCGAAPMSHPPPLTIEHAAHPGARFLDTSLAQATFSDVNLAHATFDNVALTGAVLKNVCLGGARIEDANIVGTTLNGILLSDLLAAYAQRGGA